MADKEHLGMFRQGVDAWNSWRNEQPRLRLDLSNLQARESRLSGVNLSGVDLTGADLSGADLRGANLAEANLIMGDLSRANLDKADLHGAVLNECNLSGAKLNHGNLAEADIYRANLLLSDLSGVNLSGASLREANLKGANLQGGDLRETTLCAANLSRSNLREGRLTGADLSRASLYRTNLAQADLSGATIHNISAWDLNLENARQHHLVISPPGDPLIAADNLEVAQFIDMILYNGTIRNMVQRLHSRFIAVLSHADADGERAAATLAEVARESGYLPILFQVRKKADELSHHLLSSIGALSCLVLVDAGGGGWIPGAINTLIKQQDLPLQAYLKASAPEQVLSINDARLNLPVMHYRDQDDLANHARQSIRTFEQTRKDLTNEG